MGWSPVSFGLAQGEKQEESQGLLTKLLNKSNKYQACNPKNAMDATVNMTETVGATSVSTSQTIGAQPSTSMLNDPSANKIKSLSAIGRVLASLGSNQRHVSFRDSAITRILEDSLTGGREKSKCMMFMHVAPEASSAQETRGTLEFGKGVVDNVELRK